MGIEGRFCLACRDFFVPKLGSYNAQYCCKTCKNQAHRARLQGRDPAQIVETRKRSYGQTKAHPDRMAKHRASGRTSAKKTRDWLAAYKLASGCVDCGFKAHSAALQLDHEGKKSVAISEARSSIPRLKAEIEAGQCKVRCANCHAIKTWERKQNAVIESMGLKCSGASILACN